MKTTFLAVSFTLAAACFTGCAAPSKSNPPKTITPKVSAATNALSDDKSKVSYAIGMVFGHNLQQQGMDVNLDVLLRGMKDQLAGGATLLTPQDAQTAIKDSQEKNRTQLAMKNLADGDVFLVTNKNTPGVITLPDGLQYKIITDGTGETPAADSVVTVNYRGTFLNGQEFDNSARSGKPATLQANHIIPGWTEALTKMKVGAKWQLFIPSSLAYGAAGRPPIIPPNATLVFEIELLATQTPPPSAAPAPAVAPPQQPLTSDVVAVPSAEEISRGKKPYTIKQEDIDKMQAQNRTN